MSKNRLRGSESENEGLTVDLQVNGGWGVDLLRANSDGFEKLAKKLGQQGVSAFCPTLVTCDSVRLSAQIKKLGSWVDQTGGPSRIVAGSVRAAPVGIHLEGPMISRLSAGVHPVEWIRPIGLDDWERLFELSGGNIRLITFAPEILPRAGRKKFIKWALLKGIRLSVGHTQIAYDEAREVFDLGVSSVTHAWNAMRFHHRDPGVLGASIGRKDVFVQVIPHGSHVHPRAVKWLQDLHGQNQIIAVSDLAPSAGLPKKTAVSFGEFRVRSHGEISVNKESGVLAGVGVPLSRLSKDAKINGFGFLSATAFGATPLRFLGKRVN